MLRTRRNLLVLWTLGAACAVALAHAGDDHVDGVVEPRLFVFIESDPNDSAKFEQYRDVPEHVGLSHFNINWEDSKETFGGGTWVEFDAVDLAEKDQRLKLGFGSRGLWKGEIK